MKIGVLPDRVLMSLINDRMIAKGTILDFITAFFKDYLAIDSMDDLVQLLRKARLDDRLLDFFPPQKRNLTDFDAHFKVMLMQLLQEKAVLMCTWQFCMVDIQCLDFDLATMANMDSDIQPYSHMVLAAMHQPSLQTSALSTLHQAATFCIKHTAGSTSVPYFYQSHAVWHHGPYGMHANH